MKFEVTFPDGRVEKINHSADTIEVLAVSGFGKPLVELEAEGFKLVQIHDEVLTSADVGDLNDVLGTGGAGGSNESSPT